MSTRDLTRLRGTLARALCAEDVNALGRQTGQSTRLRTVTPHRLFVSMLSALGASRIESLADLLREFNHQNDVTVAYKAFYNRLARPGFATFMHAMFTRLLERLSLQTLQPQGHRAVSRFDDIVIQDGSSFALKNTLKDVFPGRFTAVKPAAVELHATYSGLCDEVCAVELAADKEAERQFLPTPSSLKNCLLLADRGYTAVDYFEAVDHAQGAFIVRLSQAHQPWVRAAWVDGKRVALPKPIRLPAFIARHAPGHMDLDVEYERGNRLVGFRVVVLPSRAKTMTRLCTNLPRTPFSADLVSRLYRFRWQVELLFKEWKSYANLHKFNTGNPHIAAGLIWASLCAALVKRFLAHAAQLVAAKPISTRRVAMCAGHILDQIATALCACTSIATAFRDGITFLNANARRSNLAREHNTGRLRPGLTLRGVCAK